MKSLSKILGASMLAFALIFSVSVSTKGGLTPTYAYGVEEIPGGYIYGPFYTEMKGSELGGFVTLNRMAKRAVLDKYGEIDEDKVYEISYRNKVMMAHVFSQKGYIVDVECVN